MSAVLSLVAAMVPALWLAPRRPTQRVRLLGSVDRRLGAAAVLPILAVASGSIWLVVAATVPVGAWSFLARTIAERRHRRALVDSWPDVLEIVAMGISVGMSVEEMFEFVVRVGPPCARPLFDAAVSEFRAGHSRNQILTGLAQRGGSAVSPVADVLIAADRDGAPTALVLDRLAGEAGRAHALAAEERARRAPVLMLAPLTLCSLPSVIVGTIAPFVFLTFGQTSL